VVDVNDEAEVTLDVEGVVDDVGLEALVTEVAVDVLELLGKVLRDSVVVARLLVSVWDEDDAD